MDGETDIDKLYHVIALKSQLSKVRLRFIPSLSPCSVQCLCHYSLLPLTYIQICSNAYACLCVCDIVYMQLI